MSTGRLTGAPGRVSVPDMEPDRELPQRVERLEQRRDDVERGVSGAQENASAARVLATGADRDGSDLRTELRAHNRVLEALRETQVEQGLVLQEHSRILGEHSRILGEHGQVLGGLQGGMELIITLLTDPPAPAR